MRKSATRYNPGISSTLTTGVTDLMTSLAVIFILLLTAYVNRTAEGQPPFIPLARGTEREVGVLLRNHFERLGLALDGDARDPLLMRVVVPEERLHFEFGKSTLTPAAKRFLLDAMPSFAEAWCGPLRDRIDSVVIEGHTDDLGEDSMNLKLSQERSFNVMVEALKVIHETQPWAYRCVQELTSASGRGRQDLVYERDASPDRDKSRRVIFKIRLRFLQTLTSHG